MIRETSLIIEPVDGGVGGHREDAAFEDQETVGTSTVLGAVTRAGGRAAAVVGESETVGTLRDVCVKVEARATEALGEERKTVARCGGQDCRILL